MVERLRGPRAIVGIRARTVAVASASWEVEWRRYYAGLRRRFMAHFRREGGGKAAPLFHVKQDEDPWDALYAKYEQKFATYDWEDEITRKRALLEREYLAMTETVWEDVVGSQVGRRLAFDLNARGVDRVLEEVGTRITGMTRTDQGSIARAVGVFIERNSNPDELEAGISRLLQSWGESGGRAHIIALTESGNAYNLAAIAGYEETGLVERVRVFDGPDCGWTSHDDPSLAAGSTRTLQEARKYPLAHPHCQRAFAPVVLTEEVEPSEPEDTSAFDAHRQEDYEDWAYGHWGDLDPWAELPANQFAALTDYTGGGYARMNSYLRGGAAWDEYLVTNPNTAVAFTERQIEALSASMRPLPEGVVVRRAVEVDAFGARPGITAANYDWDGLVGTVVQDRGFMSTSMSPVGELAVEREVILNITVPKGTPSFPAYRISTFGEEWELLLDQGRKLLVTSVNKFGGDYVHVNATVLP